MSNAGDKDREITIEVAAQVQSPSGEVYYDWNNATRSQVWAQWLPGNTREVYWARTRLAAYVSGIYVIYDELDPRPAADEGTRIIGHDGRTYDLRPYIEVGRGEDLELPVTARGDAAGTP